MTKPRSTAVLAGTAAAAMLLADPSIGAGLTAATVLGATLTIAGAAALNNVLEHRPDALMDRTAGRPLPAGLLDARQGAVLGSFLCAAGILLLASTAGPLPAVLAAAGTAYYVLLYTILLKPRSPYAVLIGGGAGVFPALIGWTATGAAWSYTLLYLVAFVFFWSPPHFWALALVRRDEYRRAGIPVLPVARGEGETRLQILAYSLALLGLSLLPAAASLNGVSYLLVVAPAGMLFAGLALVLSLTGREGSGRLLYRYSGPYLALVIGAMVLDRLLTTAVPGGAG